MSCWMCNQFALHHKFRIDSKEGNSSRDRQTVFFASVDLMNEEHKDPKELDLTKPRLASYTQKRKKHQDTVYLLGQFSACSTKRIEVVKQDVMQSSCTIHSQLIVSRKLL